MSYEWKKQVEGEPVFTGDNSQIKTMIIEREDNHVKGIVAIRKWARYVKREERELGVTLDDVDFRPTKDGFSLPISTLPMLLKELQKIEKWAKSEGYIEK